MFKSNLNLTQLEYEKRINCHPHSLKAGNKIQLFHLCIFISSICIVCHQKVGICGTLGKTVQFVLNRNILLIFSLINIFQPIFPSILLEQIFRDIGFEEHICKYLWNPKLQKYSLELLLTHLIKKKEQCQAVSPTSDSLKSKYWLSTNNLHSKHHLDNISSLILSNSKYCSLV